MYQARSWKQKLVVLSVEGGLPCNALEAAPFTGEGRARAGALSTAQSICQVAELQANEDQRCISRLSF